MGRYDFEASDDGYRRRKVGEVPLMIFIYLGSSLLISGFIMTILAYAPTDSYLMVMVQSMGVMNFLGPIVLVIGTIMMLVGLFYCFCKNDEDYD